MSNDKLSKTLSKNALKLKMAAAINDPKILNQSKEVGDAGDVGSAPASYFSSDRVSQTVQPMQ